MRARAWSVALMTIAAAGVARAEKTKIAVLPTQFEASAAGKVPKLFDEYVLTAVQNAGDFEVVGQDDIAALIGFEQQKDLLGCDDASCLANIGGALGVDRLVAIKIAWLGAEGDWVVTAKLINLKTTRVESRTMEMVSGNVKALLRAVPGIVTKLFGGAASAPPPVPQAVAPAPTSTPATAPPRPGQPNPALGRGARVAGIIMTVSGLALAGIGGLVTAIVAASEDPDCGSSDPYSGTYASSCLEVSSLVPGLAVTVGGLAVAGWGSGIYLNGKARAASGDGEASGHVWYRWVPWLLTGVTFLGPLVFFDSSDRAWVTGVGGATLSALLFTLSMGSSSAYASTSDDREVPIASLMLLRGGGERPVPGLGIAARF